MTFGRYLLRNGLVSETMLGHATAAMVLFGGRLGTHLVELGALQPEQCELLLAKYLESTLAPRERLEKPDARALAALPEALVRRHKVFPFGLAEGRLDVAMRDPGDTALAEELARASGFAIRPFLCTELRLFFLLERHFGVERNQRYSLLGLPSAPLPEEPVLWLEDVIEPEPPPDAPRFRHLAAGEELIDVASFAALFHEEDSGSVRPALAPAARDGWLVAGADSNAALETGLAQARDRDAVVSHTLALASGRARAVALFAVRGTAQGLAGAGEIICKDLRAVLVAPEAGSLLTAAIETGKPARGEPAPAGIDARLARVLRGVEPAELAFFPIRIGARVVNVLYADNGRARLGEDAVAALSALCERAASSYERIIRERKRRLC
jgi:hypothetical protein